MGIVGWMYLVLIAGTIVTYLGWWARPKSEAWASSAVSKLCLEATA